jgi:hypothetical protein
MHLGSLLVSVQHEKKEDSLQLKVYRTCDSECAVLLFHLVHLRTALLAAHSYRHTHALCLESLQSTDGRTFTLRLLLQLRKLAPTADSNTHHSPAADSVCVWCSRQQR